MDKEEIKRIIEKVEQINHSGSGRLAGVRAEAENIRLHDNGAIADITISGPQEGRSRKFEDREYSYEFLDKYSSKKNK